MIRFKNIDITSYKSIFHCYLDFESLQGKLYSLEGINNTVNFAQSNGSGKSTLIGALMFALYGTTEDSSIKKADYQNKNTKIKLKVILNLDVQAVSYKIERTDKDFKLYKEDEDISELTKTDTEKKFWNILQLTKAEFCNFTYLAQNGSGSFLNKTPSEKLSCIKDFIFGEDLLQLQDKLNDLVKDTKAIIAISNNELAKIDGKLSVLKRQYSKSEQKFDNLPYTQEEYQNFIQDIDNTLEENNKLKREKVKQDSALQDLKRQAQKIRSDFEQVKQNICPTCGQVLHDDTVITSLREKASKINKNASIIKKAIEEIQSKLLSEDQLKELCQNLDKYKNNIYQLKQKAEATQDYTELANEIAEQEKLSESINAKLIELDFKLQQINKLNKYFKTDFIQYIQQAFLSEIESYLNIYCYDVFEDDFKLLFSNNSLEILVGEHPINYFSGGEQQRLNTIFLFAIKVALQNLTNKSTNLLILDESLSGSDSEAFENCLELIGNLTSAENLTTILVSHRDVDYQMNKIVIERFYDKTKLSIIEV